MVAIGETGLDYYGMEDRKGGRTIADLEWQRERFRVHIRAARQTQKPLVIHTRSASDDTLAILREEGEDGSAGQAGGVFHCFTETMEVARGAGPGLLHLDVGHRHLQERPAPARRGRLRAGRPPADRDRQPLSGARSYRGKTNNPSYVPYVAQQIAQVRGIPVEEVAALTSANFDQLFKGLSHETECCGRRPRGPSPLAGRAGRALTAVAAAGAGLAHASQYDDYVRAIVSDNERAMVNLIFRGFDPNTRDTRAAAGPGCGPAPGLPGRLRRAAQVPGIKVNEASQQGETPLMMACIKGHLDLAKELIRRGADVNRPGWTPLHYATSADLPQTLDIIKLLLDKSAYIDAESPNGTTPLMLAAQYSSEAVVDLLIAEGADVILRNQRGFTAADFARQVDRQYMVDKLTKAIKAERKTQPSRGSW